MKRTASYFIVITKYGDGYTATCPAFPDIACNAGGSRQAYARIKQAINARILSLFASGRTPPPDPVVQTRTLRLDLWYLREQEELQ